MQERKSTFSLLFFIKRKKLLKNGDAPVYMRVTVDGRFLEAALKRGIKPKLWNEKKQRSNGRDRLSLELNDYLDDTQTRILRIHQRFIDERKEINPKTILDEFAGRMERPKMLREIFRAENEKYRQRLEIGDLVLNTVLRAERTERYLGDFIKKQYKADDLPLSAIDNAFVRDFHLYLRTDKKQEQNTANKYCKILKRIIVLALDNKWMEVNPFQGLRFQAKATNRQFLSEKELTTIMKKTFTLERLNVVRDIFIFCALTGLSFSDVEGLKPEHISQDDDGNFWIHKARQKTKNICLPLVLFCLLFGAGKANAQWTVIDPSNIAQSIVNSSKSIVQESKTATHMVKSFQETVKIYQQAKKYYDALQSVNNLVRDARKVQQTILMLGNISGYYVNNFQKMLTDPNFTSSELSAIASGYTRILEEANGVFGDLKQVVNITTLSMTDKDRMDVVDDCYKEMKRLKNLTAYYTNKNISVSYLRAKKKADTQRVINLYGDGSEKYW